jgi:cobalamin biosynthesis protein CobW
MNGHAQALVVSGFLGSGKTTLVRRLLEDGQREGIRTAVVSNEFGALGIDEALLAGTAHAVSDGSGVDFVELAGGCVCCRLSDDLLRTLHELWTRTHPERVIVETSGVVQKVGLAQQ